MLNWIKKSSPNKLNKWSSNDNPLIRFIANNKTWNLLIKNDLHPNSHERAEKHLKF